jgi:hypothetical protein
MQVIKFLTKQALLFSETLRKVVIDHSESLKGYEYKISFDNNNNIKEVFIYIKIKCGSGGGKIKYVNDDLKKFSLEWQFQVIKSEFAIYKANVSSLFLPQDYKIEL